MTDQIDTVTAGRRSLLMSYQRPERSQPYASYTLPQSPPLTPPLLGDVDPMSAHSSSYDLESPGSTHRYGFSRSSGSGPAASLDSPMSMPALHRSELHEEYSPAGSTAIVTPDGPDPIISTPKMSSDHSVLSSMSQQVTPKLVIPESSFVSRGFPLLPPHHPLRSKMYSTVEQPAPISPAHTPKGHPIDRSRPKTYFDYNSKTRPNPLTNPFSYGDRTYASSLPYLLRIPRRLRPILLLGVCVITFGLVFLSRAMSHAKHMDHVLLHRQQTGFARRQMEMVFTNNQHPVFSAQTDRQGDATNQGASSTVAPLVFQNAKQELAALISFITSTTANALPSINPNAPLDPHVVLDFDPSHPNARDDLELLQSEINTIYPIIVLGKMRDPWHREIKRILAEYKITPAPLIIDVDQRRDHSIIIPLVARLLGTSQLPQLLLQGEVLGSYHDILNMRDTGVLSETLEESGAVKMRELKKKKKKGVKQRERDENERILGPAPIVPA